MATEDKTISERIEGVVDGILRFLIRLVRTSWVILTRPFGWTTILEDADPAERKFILPLTYLVLGGFIYTLIISVYPTGFTNLLDILWFDEEIGQTLKARLKEATSITGLIAAAFPVFLTVTIFAGVAGLLIKDQEHRQTFRRINYYAFGFHCMALFSPLLVLMFLEIATTVIQGPYVEPTLNPEILDALSFVILAGVIGIVLVALVTPLVSLTVWRVRTGKPVLSPIGAVGLIAMMVYAAALTFVLAYTAAIPAQFSLDTNQTPVSEVVLDFVGDQMLLIEANSDGNYTATTELYLVVKNQLEGPFIDKASSIGVRIIKEVQDAEVDFWHDWDSAEVMKDGVPLAVLHVPTAATDIFQVTAKIDLPIEEVQLIQNKKDGGEGGNDYGYFLAVVLNHHGSESVRMVALPWDTEISPRP